MLHAALAKLFNYCKKSILISKETWTLLVKKKKETWKLLPSLALAPARKLSVGEPFGLSTFRW